jgi:hypothetical protein
VKNLSTALRNHYAGDVTTLTTCWKATLQNGTVVAATKLDRDLVIDGVTYQSVVGYFDSDVENSAELNPDNLEIDGFLASPAITNADIHSGAWDYAAIEMFEVNYNDLTMGKNILRTGTLGEVKGGRIKFTAELRGLMQAYTRTIVRLMTKDCNADLGDGRCKVDMTLFTATGTVGSSNSTNSVIYDAGRTEAGPDGAKAITGISRAASAVVTCPAHGFATNATVQLSDIVGCILAGATKDGVFYAGSGDSVNGMLFQISVIDADHFSIPLDTRSYNADSSIGVTDPLQVYSSYVSGGLAHPANASGYFDHGTITFNSGANSGLSMEVKAYAPGVITLMLPMPFAVVAGDAYTIKAGCNQAFETCQQRFGNVVNYRGFPNLPQSKIYRRGAEGVGTTDGTSGTGGSSGTGAGSGGGASSAAPTLYVSTTGSDSNSGTSAATPFLTIAHAASVANPGDVILVANGTYSFTSGTSGAGSTGMVTSCSGTASQPITFVSATPYGAKLVDAGLGITWQHNGNYTIIDGFEITGSQRIGIYLTGDSCEVRHNYIHDLLAHGGAGGPGGAAIDGIGANMVIHRNHINNIDVAKYTGSSLVQGIYIAGAGWTVKNNVVSNVASTNIQQWHGATASTIVNNTLFHSTTGIMLGDGDSGALPGGSADNLVANNIVYDHSGYGIREYGAVGTNNRYYNNLVFSSGTDLALNTGATESGTISASPLFVTYQSDGSGDYHLASGSPAIGAGLAAYAPATDYSGLMRTSPFDLGAYKYTGA